ncbi:MAG: 16S rRNA (cytosine(1402)-N(4))-methyltransferase, partial [Tannerella sp.]|nr:16S rRNA (cytosine(1402)-N(4))-methyltransferase [Tannerella sp.]
KEKEKKFMAQVFQSLRIEVNDEIRSLHEMLKQALQALKPGGRLVVITYHSLEDRAVKNFFRAGNFEGESEQDFYGNRLTPFLLVNNKVITPTAEEIEKNPRARSAKLRIAEKK